MLEKREKYIILFQLFIVLILHFEQSNERIKCSYMGEEYLIAKKTYVNEKLEGWYEHYYPNENIMFRVFIKNGKGYGRKFHETGELLGKGRYKTRKHFGSHIAVKTGVHYYFYKDGTLNSIIEHDYLKFNGMFYLFHKNGNRYVEGEYNREGNPVGVWRVFTPQDSLAKEKYFENGKLKKELKYIDFAEGKKLFEALYYRD